MSESNDFNQLVSINDTINQILSKVLTIYEIVNRQSDHLSGKKGSMIEIDEDDVPDLLISFIDELERFQVNHNLRSGNYDPEDIKNKASFYFNNKPNISNPRAYLSKIVLSIKPIKDTSTVTSISKPRNQEPEPTNDEKERIEYVRSLIPGLTDDIIQEVLNCNEFALRWIKTVNLARMNPIMMYYVADHADKMGLIHE